MNYPPGLEIDAVMEEIAYHVWVMSLPYTARERQEFPSSFDNVHSSVTMLVELAKGNPQFQTEEKK